MMATTMSMMKCKKHPYEQGVGVCASCLRERLLEVIAARSGRTPQRQSPLDAAESPNPAQQLREQQQPPPPLVFPRSVSPYVSRRRSVDLDLHGDDDVDPRYGRRQKLRFFSTPQVGRRTSRRAAGARFLASLFGGGHHSRSEEAEQDYAASSASHHGSGSWFSALLPGRKKKQQQKKNKSHFFEDEAAVEGEARRRWNGRGVDVRGVVEDDSASDSGYSTESSGGWRIPAPTPMRKHAPSARRAMSGFVVCLSPLVRPSPRHSQPGEGGVAVGLTGELQGTGGSSLHHRHHHHHHHHHRHGSGGGGPLTLGPSQSRKLADLGRFR